MPNPHVGASPSNDPPASLVRAELGRILASELFTRSERLSSFLNFIVARTLAGQGESLKEQVIAVELYGKGADFDTAADPIVRVDARRLRDKLREYYATTAPPGIVISVPKGSYAPVFRSTVAEFAPAAGHVSANPDAVHQTDDVALPGKPWAPPPAAIQARLSRWWWMAVVTLIAAGSWGAMRLRITDGSAPSRLLTVTSMPGAEEDASLSPDGNFVVFSWDGGSAPDAAHDIWIKAVGGDGLRQLTNTPDASEQWPAWSADGQYIAFTRFIKGRPSIVKVSALGGPEQLVATGVMATWTPDGLSLVMNSRKPNGRYGLVQHILDTGARQELTDAPAGFAEGHPRVSPDGKTLAFVRSGDGRSALLLVPMSGGEPTTLLGWRSGSIGGLAWTPDGQEIFVARPEVSGRRLVRIGVDGRGPAVPVPGIPYESLGPSVSRPLRGRDYRLAIHSGQPDIGLRLVDLQPPRQGTTFTSDSPFCDSTRMDVPGRFSRDGSQVAFASDRSGSQQVWVANRDGSALRSVTQLQDATVSVGSWSPDGRFVTFDATIGERTHIYVASASGGPIKRLTDGTATEIDPEWSRDGRWIYYASNESGGWAIWKIAAAGGARVPLTTEPGFEPRESPDGRSIYFGDTQRAGFGRWPVGKLKKVSIEGGPTELVNMTVKTGAWELTDTGIVFIDGSASPSDASGPPDVLQVYDFAERRVRTLGELPFRVSSFGVSHFLTVSPDARWALASHIDRWDRDIFVVDNFR